MKEKISPAMCFTLCLNAQTTAKFRDRYGEREENTPFKEYFWRTFSYCLYFRSVVRMGR